MKFLAVIDVAPGAPMDQIRSGLADELRAAWALFAKGALREAYATEVPTRVVFVLEADDAAQANADLRALPLVAAGLFRIELTELRPFANWSRLFAP